MYVYNKTKNTFKKICLICIRGEILFHEFDCLGAQTVTVHALYRNMYAFYAQNLMIYLSSVILRDFFVVPSPTTHYAHAFLLLNFLLTITEQHFPSPLV